VCLTAENNYTDPNTLAAAVHNLLQIIPQSDTRSRTRESVPEYCVCLTAENNYTDPNTPAAAVHNLLRIISQADTRGWNHKTCS